MQNNSETVQTYSLWIWPYLCLRNEAQFVASGLTLEMGELIIAEFNDRGKGMLFLEPEEAGQEEG